MVGVAAVVGFVLGFLQAIFQLQDQAMPFAVKLLACVASLIVLGPWVAGLIIGFANQVLEVISMPSLYG